MTKKRWNGYRTVHGGTPTGRTIVSTRGHTIALKLVTVPCKRCGQDFTCEIATRAPAYCPACQEIADRERRTRERERAAKKRMAPPSEKPRRLIPYAGYDPTENPYRGGYKR